MFCTRLEVELEDSNTGSHSPPRRKKPLKAIVCIKKTCRYYFEGPRQKIPLPKNSEIFFTILL